jgi:hypothetical protein
VCEHLVERVNKSQTGVGKQLLPYRKWIDQIRAFYAILGDSFFLRSTFGLKCKIGFFFSSFPIFFHKKFGDFKNKNIEKFSQIYTGKMIIFNFLDTKKNHWLQTFGLKCKNWTQKKIQVD